MITEKSLFKTLFLAAGWAGFFAAAPAPARAGEDAVVLVHGILNKPVFLKRIQNTLEDEGYTVYNWGYPSTEKSIEDLSKDLEVFVSGLPAAGEIHFVGFSLGTQVLRHYLARRPPPRAGRFVMIAPPNHGSPLIGRLKDLKAVTWIYGNKAFGQMDAANGAFLDSLGTPKVPFGIIAGGWGNDTGFSPLIPGDDDGSVPVESARLAGAADFLLLRYEHTWLLARKETARQTAAFLKNGRFTKKR
jgi:triacylglycerol lipase